MTLEQCTKKELIEIINYLSILDAHRLRMALNDVKYNRSVANIKKAEALDKKAEQHFAEYIAVLKKIENKEPVSAIERIEAQKHLIEYQRLSEESEKLMRVERR